MSCKIPFTCSIGHCRGMSAFIEIEAQYSHFATMFFERIPDTTRKKCRDTINANMAVT